MAYIRKYTNEELSRIRSENARRGAETRKRNGTNNGGRKRALPGLIMKSKTMTVRESDYLDLQKIAFSENKPLVEMFHIVMSEYKKYYTSDEDEAPIPKTVSNLSDEEKLFRLNAVRKAAGVRPLEKLPPGV